MEILTEYLAMGGYAQFVWPAYGLSAAVLAGLYAAARRRLRLAERALAALQAAAPSASGASQINEQGQKA